MNLQKAPPHPSPRTNLGTTLLHLAREEPAAEGRAGAPGSVCVCPPRVGWGTGLSFGEGGRRGHTGTDAHQALTPRQASGRHLKHIPPSLPSESEHTRSWMEKRDCPRAQAGKWQRQGLEPSVVRPRSHGASPPTISTRLGNRASGGRRLGGPRARAPAGDPSFAICGEAHSSAESQGPRGRGQRA